MPTYEERLELLADALGVRVDQLVPALRRKSVQYYDADGVLLFDGRAWPDDRLLEAAVSLFIDQDVR